MLSFAARSRVKTMARAVYSRHPDLLGKCTIASRDRLLVPSATSEGIATLIADQVVQFDLPNDSKKPNSLPTGSAE